MSKERVYKCANSECRKVLDNKTMETCYYGQMHYYVCDSKCMNLFYNPKKEVK